MPAAATRILIAHDVETDVALIRKAFESAGADVEITAAGTLHEYRERAASGPPDLALVDLDLPDGRALDVLTSPSEAAPFPVVVMAGTGNGNEQMVTQALKSGALDYVVKSPDAFSAMPRTVARVLREWSRRKSGDDGDLPVSAELTEPAGEQRLPGTFSDITECKRAEDALQESRELYCSLFENMLEGYAYCKMLFADGTPQDFVYLGVNSAFEKLTGLKHVVGKKVSEVIPGIREKNPELFQIYGRVALTGKPERFETYLDSLGTWFSVAVYSPRKEHFVAVFDNITQRKKAEKTLRDSEERLNLALASSRMGVWEWDVRTNDVFWSPECYSIFGHENPDVTLESFTNTLHPEDAARVTAEARLALAKRSAFSAEFRIVRPGGEVRWVSNFGRARYDEHGNPLRLVGTVQDITERKQAEKALSDSEKNYRTLIDNALVGVYRCDIEGKFLYVNDAMTRIFGCDSPEEMLRGEMLLRPKSRKDGEDLLEQLRVHGKVSNYEVEIPTKTGGYINVLTSAALDNGIISGMVLDITEYKKLEEQLRQAQKIEAIGLLAGGVAHDFNNILSAIVGYSHLVLMNTQENDPLRHYVRQIQESTDRAAVLTQSLLAFSRKQPVNLAVIDLNAVVKEFEKLLRRLIREDIALKINCAEGPLSIMADRGQMEQMIMNLVTNARDAMPGGGRLIIDTRTVSLDRDFIDAHGYGKEGEYAFVAVSDTGIGMNEKTASRVFEPFFTTKEEGKGTGLGLSMVYGIVKKHEGFINVYSEPGKGTTFKIYLPKAREAAEADRKKNEPPVAPQGGTETILVAEDDAALRQMSAAVLGHFGYTVIEAVNGVDAVAKFKENREKIRLVILDGIMPRMNGMEAFRKIKAMTPDVRCIFMSGYAADIFTKDGIPDREAELIVKPFSPVDLLKKIREALDR